MHQPRANRSNSTLPSFLANTECEATEADDFVDVVPEPEAAAAVEDAPELAAEELPGDAPAAAPRASMLVPLLLGGSLLAAGPLLGTLLTAERLATLAAYGITPTTCLLAGVAWWAAAWVQRALSNQIDNQLAQTNASLRDAMDATMVPEADTTREDLHAVLLALHRQDDKLAQLTKAVRLYGKPLMEIATAAASTTNSVQQTQAGVQELESTANQLRREVAHCAAAVARLETRPAAAPPAAPAPDQPEPSYQTGERNSAGAGVLSAIQKLRQLKGS